MTSKFITVLSLILGVVNVCLFIFWICLVNSGSNKYALENTQVNSIALQIDVLSILISVVGVFLVVLGVVGYAEIKETAVRAAKEKLDEDSRKTYERISSKLDSQLRKLDEDDVLKINDIDIGTAEPVESEEEIEDGNDTK